MFRNRFNSFLVIGLLSDRRKVGGLLAQPLRHGLHWSTPCREYVGNDGPGHPDIEGFSSNSFSEEGATTFVVSANQTELQCDERSRSGCGGRDVASVYAGFAGSLATSPARGGPS